MKLKTCSSCGIECYLWKSTPKICKSCAVKKSIQIGSIKITTKPQPKIKQFSDKKIKELAVYRKERDKFLKSKSVCEYPRCESTELTCHHSEGRIGSNLTDASKFRALCWKHHLHIETHPDEAKQLGLSADRL